MVLRKTSLELVFQLLFFRVNETWSCNYVELQDISYYYFYIVPRVFFTSALADGFSLEFEWQQVSRTLLRILADLKKDLVWMVSTRPLISKSSSLCTNSLVIPTSEITINTTIIFIFHHYQCYYNKRIQGLLWLIKTLKAWYFRMLWFRRKVSARDDMS